MPQLLRSDRETSLGAEPTDDVVDRGAGQTMALAGPVEIDEQRTGFGAACLEPSGECGPGRLRQGHRFLLLRTPPAEDQDPIPRQVDILDVEPHRLAAAQ